MCECEVPRERGHVQCDVLYMLIVVTYRNKSCVEVEGKCFSSMKSYCRRCVTKIDYTVY